MTYFCVAKKSFLFPMNTIRNAYIVKQSRVRIDAKYQSQHTVHRGENASNGVDIRSTKKTVGKKRECIDDAVHVPAPRSKEDVDD